MNTLIKLFFIYACFSLLSGCSTPQAKHCSEIDDVIRPINKGMVEIDEEQR